MSEKIKEVAQEEVTDLSVELQDGSIANDVFGSQAQVMTTFDTSTEEGSDKAFNMMNNADFGIADKLGETILLKDVLMHPVEFMDETTGEVVKGVRTVLIDADGKTYGATSSGLFNALKQFFGIKGHPSTWSEPKAIQIVEKRSRKGFRFYTIQIVAK